MEIAKFYLAQLVHAIHYIHTQDIVHRDLKPENLLLSEDGHLKVIDFGIAKHIPYSTELKRHTLCGTVEYLVKQCNFIFTFF